MKFAALIFACLSLQAQAPRALAPESVVLRIETAAAPLEVTLQQLMEIFRDPGFSMAVIDNYQIAWAKGYGTTQAGGKVPVTTETLFQAASISKPVSAAGILALVQSGKLQLDEDVNVKLRSWKVPENQFTTTEKVTLRRIMSHSAGLNVHGFPGYPVGAPLPTLVQILNGEKPANTAAVRVEAVPGTASRYSGGGVTIETLLIEEVTGKSFPVFLQESVFNKLGMRNSSFVQVLPPALASRAAIATHADGKPVDGNWHLYPELAPDGLWTTPSDLAKFAIEIALSKHGKANRILSRALTLEMLKPQIVADGGASGLGWGLGDGKSPELLQHNGANKGFGSQLMMLSDSGQGLVAMGNSDAFSPVSRFVASHVANMYHWKWQPPAGGAADILIVISALRGLDAALAHENKLTRNASTLNALGYYLLGGKRHAEAIRVFERNIAAFPQDWNGYDSLGEAHAASGNTARAIANYEKSLELNPANENGRKALRKLRPN
ncbi:serine hydrolase [Bryobacter aggregatus]|uniref:serine hydrolase n=1 Tax=Bryobacter aggregatus TaxID=360054 RepID=UPI00068D6F80|nr:serine hydrolase [Bryobacter aggregatus]